MRNIVRCAAVVCTAWPPILPTRYVCNIQFYIRRNLIIQNIQSHVYTRVRERIRCTSFSVIFGLPLFIRFISRIWRFCKNRWKMPRSRFIAMMANDDEMNNMSLKTKQNKKWLFFLLQWEETLKTTIRCKCSNVICSLKIRFFFHKAKCKQYGGERARECSNFTIVVLVSATAACFHWFYL